MTKFICCLLLGALRPQLQSHLFVDKADAVPLLLPMPDGIKLIYMQYPARCFPVPLIYAVQHSHGKHLEIFTPPCK